jgi:HEPN domain-containing protein
MQELTKEWVDKAEKDIYSADLLLHAGEVPVPDYACFHCQQGAEKYLKAYLQEHQIEFERKHNLIPLVLLCQSLDSDFKQLKKDLSQLERYAVVVRYPGIAISVNTAEDALKAADRVRKFVRRKLKAE